MFPKIDHSKLGRANSFSTSPRAATPGAFSPRCGKAGGGSRRRFFGLSEAAEAEAEAAAASSVDDRRCSVGGAGRDEDAHGERERRPTPLPGRLSVSSCEDGRGGEVIDAHRMVVSLRSEPMRAMLRSGESCVHICDRRIVYKPYKFACVVPHVRLSALEWCDIACLLGGLLIKR